MTVLSIVFGCGGAWFLSQYRIDRLERDNNDRFRLIETNNEKRFDLLDASIERSRRERTERDNSVTGSIQGVLLALTELKGTLTGYMQAQTRTQDDVEAIADTVAAHEKSIIQLQERINSK